MPSTSTSGTSPTDTWPPVGTLIGFILVITTGLFGSKLGFVSGWATLTLVAESLATAVLVTAGALLWRETA